MITIVDIGTSNIQSVVNALEVLGDNYCISKDPNCIQNASKIVLPGVGAFGEAVARMRASGIFDALIHAVIVKQTPILGICLGMQLFCRKSEENSGVGLSWIEADVKRIKVEHANLRVPHIGWNDLFDCRGSLMEKIEEQSCAYFVHGYHVYCYDPNLIVAKVRYGTNLVAAIQRDNIYGVQFHPEKSHKVGLQVLKNFSQI